MMIRKSVLFGALALAVGGPAMAETSVTLYGLIDMGVSYQRGKAGGDDSTQPGLGTDHRSKIGVADGTESGSRWGLRGTEELGDGLSAVFVLESGFNTATGRSTQNDRMFGRQATVGLAGDFGQLDLGRQVNVASNYMANIDPFALDFVQANMGTVLSSANTVRYDNMIMYQTPSFSGFQLGGGYSFNADSDVTNEFRTNENVRAITTGAKYEAGPLFLAASYDQLNYPGSQPRVKEWNIGGAYDFEVVKLGLAYGRTMDGVFAGQDVLGNNVGNGLLAPDGSGITNETFTWDGLRINSYMAGLTVPIGASSSVFGSWQRADPNKGLDKTDVYSLGYTYALSKRTNMYAVGSYADGYGFVDGNKAIFTAVGIRHQF